MLEIESFRQIAIISAHTPVTACVPFVLRTMAKPGSYIFNINIRKCPLAVYFFLLCDVMELENVRTVIKLKSAKALLGLKISYTFHNCNKVPPVEINKLR